MTTNYTQILVREEGPVGIITLNRPSALNALSSQLTGEVVEALRSFDKNPKIGAIVLTGSHKVFAAGADIKQMGPQSMGQVMKEDVLNWTAGIRAISKPIIAAVNGYALGGGCELAMLCDIIYAGENALFGQPEINLGLIPGAGGTQRLVKAVGKSKAMEMNLTGKVNLRAHEAYNFGLVSGVYPVDKVLDKAIETAKIISEKSQPIVGMIKDAVNQSFEMPLSSGLIFERRLFQMTFGTQDRKEGISAFINKRKPKFSHL
ncbi:hypothetical protein BB559_001091 [Furculomyces boomerangus]|uniref:Probable enoyl-CoA hydratase, mitochondrial n=2 Tax=Harpellales TaxID=61421 RepID=A0A2T9Z062_9FUNG|nr:hypothetical protein BB559_001849 [Furculomyces boomerangus]PVU99012.1 hypothetical protein BB559_001091 [Furculomyces boomerangus]PWA03769.1 hypothetical protein BB558_000043 [Smittium angustum]